MHLRRSLVLAAAVAVLVAPAAARAATGPAASPATAAEQRWLSIVEQLSVNVADAGRDATLVGGSVASARALLVDTQTLFGLAVAYGVFSGCTQTVRDAGRPTARLRAVRNSINAACRPLIRASKLFLGAIRGKRAQALVSAEARALVGMKLMTKAAARAAAFRKAHPCARASCST